MKSQRQVANENPWHTNGPGEIVSNYVSTNNYTTAAGISALGGLALSYPLIMKANRNNEPEVHDMNKRILAITGVLLGLGVASTIKRISDKKKLGEKENPILGEDEITVRYLLSMSGCYVSVNGYDIYGYNTDKTYKLPKPTKEEKNLIGAAKTPQEMYNVLKPMLLRCTPNGLNSTFESGNLTLTDAVTYENICSDGGGGSDGGGSNYYYG